MGVIRPPCRPHIPQGPRPARLIPLRLKSKSPRKAGHGETDLGSSLSLGRQSTRLNKWSDLAKNCGRSPSPGRVPFSKTPMMNVGARRKAAAG